jgi:glycosyltransferase involved in cell wall biosynthesis
MKILIATFTFSPNKDGVSEAASAQAKAFLAQGWSVDVATEPTSPKRTTLNWNGAKIHEFAITGSPYFRNPYKGDAVIEYCDFLCAGDWDVIIFHSYSWSLYLAVPFLDKISAKKILVSHGYWALIWIPVHRFPFGLLVLAHGIWQSIRMLMWIKRIHRWVFLSSRPDFRTFYDLWLAKAIDHPGIAVIPNGVAALDRDSLVQSFRKQMGIPQSSVFFLCVANYFPGKDQAFAAKAFRQAAIPGSCLVFIGSVFNEFSAEFQKADAPYALPEAPGKIIWLEKQARETTIAAFADCDVFVLSSYREAQPIAILEGMAHHKPWIARRAGCIPELPGGFCVKSEKTMARAMKILATDSNLRLHLGQLGRDSVDTLYNRKMYNSSFCRLVRDIGT